MKVFGWGRAVIFAALWGALASPALAETYQMMVFSNPVAGQETEYNRWYDNQHAPDVVAVPGFRTAQRFVLSENPLLARSPPVVMPRYLVLFTISTDDLPAVMAESRRRAQTGLTKVSPTLDRTTADVYVYRNLGPRIAGAGGEPAEARPGPAQVYDHIVFTVPLEGREEAFDQWYDQHHAPEMASIPGMVSAQRLVLEDPGPGPIKPSHYAALFEIKTADMPAVSAAMRARMKSMVEGTDIDLIQTRGYTYRALGPVIDGDAIRRQRRR